MPQLQACSVVSISDTPLPMQEGPSMDSSLLTRGHCLKYGPELISFGHQGLVHGELS